MAKDKKEGSACMICMNVILLILGIAVFGCGIYLSVGKEIPPVFASLTEYLGMAIAFGVALIIFSILGFCAACGGCFLFVYAVVITLCSVFCIVMTIVLLVLFFTIKGQGDSSPIIEFIDNSTLTIIETPEYAETWKSIQDNLNCCGYEGVEKTGDQCLEATYVDCRDGLFTVITDYSLFGAIAMLVVTIVLLILNCASCVRLKSGCSN